MSDAPQRVLFVCTHNSARSQMAEGMLRAWGGDAFEPFSAGTEQTFVRLEAIEVMDEIGIDIGAQQSKTLDGFVHEAWDWVITVCDRALEACPVLPGARTQAHWSIDDPSAAGGTDEERVDAFRRARDALRPRIEALVRDGTPPMA